MKRSGMLSLGGILFVAVGAFVWSLLAGNTVLLGLDLEGGAEVVLEPATDTELRGTALDDALDRSVEIIRNRVDGLGVAEPDITRQGNRVVVQLPGVADQQRALEVVGQTAELRFRPVCLVLPADVIDVEELGEALGADGDSTNDRDDVARTDESSSGESADDQVGEGPTPRPFPLGISPLDIDPMEGLDATSENGEGGIGCENVDIDFASSLTRSTTTREEDDPDATVVLPEFAPNSDTVIRRYLLGRTMLTGAALEDADATNSGFEWLVRPTFRSGEEGIDLFNAAAQACNFARPACPSQQLGIVLDGIVESAPTVKQPFFQRDQITITGNFDQSEAEDTALILKFGALPLEFSDPTDPESGSRVRLVSATLGKDSLRAGVVAGIVGFALVALYVLAYYRLLGVAAILSLAVSGTMLWVVLAFLSETSSLALTLAGVVGLVVAIGTSLDSNVVYFEHLKEDIANGRTLRSSVDRSFPVAFRTIFYANAASLIGAVILYFLTVGSVRGFALMLGLASVLDLVATYFFLRPFVRIMARGELLLKHPGMFGLPRPGASIEAGSS